MGRGEKLAGEYWKFIERLILNTERKYSIDEAKELIIDLISNIDINEIIDIDELLKTYVEDENAEIKLKTIKEIISEILPLINEYLERLLEKYSKSEIRNILEEYLEQNQDTCFFEDFNSLTEKEKEEFFRDVIIRFECLYPELCVWIKYD